MYKKTITAIILGSFSTLSFADMGFDFKGDFTYGKNDTTGSIENNSLDKDLGIEKSEIAGLSIAFEHFVPILPNFKWELSEYSEKNQNSNSNGSFDNNIMFSTNDYTGYQLRTNDLIGYYEILEEFVWLSLDLGIGYTMTDGYIQIEEEDYDLDENYASGYISTQLNFPRTNWYVGVDYKEGINTDNKYNNTRGYLGYISKDDLFNMGIRVGYNYSNNEFHNELGDIEIENKGPYIALNYHFF